MDTDRFIDQVRAEEMERFERSEEVFSFSTWLEKFFSDPSLHLRPAARYLADMFEHFSTRQSSRVGQEARRFLLFDLEASGAGDSLIGHERVQEDIHRYLAGFARRGKADKMLLLHGPNGSGKTTVTACIGRGLEEYSRTPRGALYTFDWVFSDREDRADRIGFEPGALIVEETSDYSDLPEKDITARFACEQRDPPLFLVPRSRRRALIKDALERLPQGDRPDYRYDYFLDGDLCQKCRQIYDRLLVAGQGDWRRVIRHVQVRRYEISRRYRAGVVSIEPQGNVDATTRPILSDRAWNIPSTLRNAVLYEPVGDIISANHGVLEYSDFLKRPLEANKYLLTTCEQGTVTLPNCIAFLDLVILGTANEKQLSVFKRMPDFSSFKARMELIPVPYLLRHSTEAELYKRHIRSYARDRHISPHAAEVAALWAVLTRLRRPRLEAYDPPLRATIAELTPLDKARLYDCGEPPERFTEEQKRLVRSALLEIRQEFEEEEGEFEGLIGAEYEGRRGVSPREMLGVIARAASRKTFRCLTPMAIFEALDELLKDTSLYDFLRLPVDQRFHDMPRLLEDARSEYYRWVTTEVYDSIDLVDATEYDRVFLEYFRHVKAFHTREQVYVPSTGGRVAPSEELMNAIESQVGIKEPPAEFRSGIMTRIAAWSLDHQSKAIDYHSLFGEIYQALRRNFYREQYRMLTLIEEDILKYGTDEFSHLSAADQKQVKDALGRMEQRYDYCSHCARDVIAHVIKYRLEHGEEADAGGSG